MRATTKGQAFRVPDGWLSEKVWEDSDLPRIAEFLRAAWPTREWSNASVCPDENPLIRVFEDRSGEICAVLGVRALTGAICVELLAVDPRLRRRAQAPPRRAPPD